MIGVFDSGVGGLTVLKELREAFPRADFLYFGDTARVPYGTRSKEVVCRYSKELVTYLISEGAKVIVVACNTASANALEGLRKAFPEILFMGVVEPAAEEAVAVSKGKIGIVGTNATVSSGAYTTSIRRLNPDMEIYQVACPLLVPLVEHGFGDHVVSRRVVRLYTRELRDRRVDTLILGCTHYPLLKSIFSSVMRGTKIVESGKAVAERLKEVLVVRGMDELLEGEARLTCVCSDHVEGFYKMGSTIIPGLKETDVGQVTLDDIDL